MKNGDLQVLIVGAGPTGLTLACDLARRKIRFRIVDKASEFFIGSKGKGLQPRSLRPRPRSIAVRRSLPSAT
jgi:2-polyprenyl-6-methoxyphenol hydroxylase-like FAD-dependent oxidoreductase